MTVRLLIRGTRLLAKGDQLSMFGPTREVLVHAHTREGHPVAQHERTIRVPTHHETWAGKGAPKPGEKGYRAPPTRPVDAFNGRSPAEVAESAVANALRYYEDPEVFHAWTTEPDAVDENGDPELWTQADLPDLLELPHHDAGGRELSLDERISMAAWIFRHVIDDFHYEGQLPGTENEEEENRYLKDGWRLEPWAVAAVLADALEPRDNQRLRLDEVSKAEATAFVAAHHSHLPEINLRGTMFTLGLRRGDRLVAVATAGTPTGRWADPHRVLELTRVASDGTTMNASSMLTGRVIDLLKKTGRALFVTYTFPGEEGASYKALKDKGLRPVAQTTPHKSQVRREGGSTRSASDTSGLPKLRWEAGPDAGPARWDLLDESAPGEGPQPPR